MERATAPRQRFWFHASILLLLAVEFRGGVEDTRLEAKAKDTKKKS